MDQGTPRVKPLAPVPPGNDMKDLDREIATLRGRLDGLLGELDHRRHEALDFRLQLGRYAGTLGLVAAGVVALGAGLVWLGVHRARMRRRPMDRAHRMRQALARAIDKPDAVAKPSPSVGKKVLAAGASTLVTTLVKRLVERSLVAPPRRATATAR